MIKSPIVISIIIIIALLVIGSQSVYIVDETNHAVVTQFGKITATKSTPGLQFKTPFIQNVSYLDKRILTLDTPSQEFLTSDDAQYITGEVIRVDGGMAI